MVSCELSLSNDSRKDLYSRALAALEAGRNWFWFGIQSHALSQRQVDLPHTVLKPCATPAQILFL